jgi:uncharacterized protein YbcI
MSSFSFSQMKKSDMEQELSKLEKEFTQAIVKNDPDTIERFIADDWIIIDADGGIIDKERFLGAIKSGALTHEMMEADNIRIRIYGERWRECGRHRAHPLQREIHGTGLQYA